MHKNENENDLIFLRPDIEFIWKILKDKIERKNPDNIN